MADINDYSNEMTEAACSVMLELVRVLGEYRDDMRIIGGWVPELLVSRDSSLLVPNSTLISEILDFSGNLSYTILWRPGEAGI